MKRSDFSQLPRSEELFIIMQKEASRPLPVGKAGVHYIDFQSIKTLLKVYGVQSSFFDINVATSDVVKDGILEKGEECITPLSEKIMSAKPTHTQLLALDEVYNYLSEEDLKHKADIIFVFGAKTPFRLERAVELYQKGLAPKIMISGGKPIYGGNRQTSEAELYAEIALKLGVPANALILESESITVADNVRRSLNMLDNTVGGVPKNILLVNSPYTQRRGWGFFMKYLSQESNLIRVNCLTAEKYSAESWFKNRDGVGIILNEFVKLKVAVLLDSA